MRRLVLTGLILFPLLQGCLQTTAEVKERQRLEGEESAQRQRLFADLSLKNQDLQNEVGQLTGRVEELQNQLDRYKRESYNEQSLLKEQIALLQAQVRDNESQIKKVSSSKVSNRKKSESTSSLYKKAIRQYKDRKYKQAQKNYQILLKRKKLTQSKRLRIFHNLGMIDYIGKKYSDAQVYFSKVYANAPNSKYAPNSLLHIGLSFLALEQIPEAKEILKEVIRVYPKSSHAKTAKNRLSKID